MKNESIYNLSESPINWLYFPYHSGLHSSFPMFILLYQRDETGHCKCYDMKALVLFLLLYFIMKNWSQFVKFL